VTVLSNERVTEDKSHLIHNVTWYNIVCQAVQGGQVSRFILLVITEKQRGR